jgi:hypothetical protein
MMCGWCDGAITTETTRILEIRNNHASSDIPICSDACRAELVEQYVDDDMTTI